MFFSRMKLSSVAGFTRRFGTGLHAGANIVDLLRAEAKQGSARQRDALNDLADQASQGEQLHAAMKRSGQFFPPLLQSMTRVGESTGRLERTMFSLASHYETQLALRRAFIGAITLPMLQLIAGLGVLSLLIWILGVLTPATGGQMSDVLGLGLRGPRGVLIFWGYILAILALIFGSLWAFSRNVAGVQNLIPLLYMIPGLGPSLQTITLARFSRTLALSLDAGLDPVRSIQLALDSTDSDYYRAASGRVEQAIRGGATLSGALEAASVFPDDFTSRVEVAELSGTDAESIDGLANEYDERAKTAMRAIAGLASGLVWATMILVLLFFIVRLLMSVMGLYDQALQPI
ncbi:Type II secretion system protein F [Crateriforma conspicua]|uniref:Type II secretion system protein F n=2 Tax=Crateriforma conspicua TaxID=2527996 RepID=A0A5C5YDI0_9PLAN|nr:Type II secretion system protein F [Crateriforma conspicua]